MAFYCWAAREYCSDMTQHKKASKARVREIRIEGRVGKHLGDKALPSRLLIVRALPCFRKLRSLKYGGDAVGSDLRPGGQWSEYGIFKL
jgi:hypothetical protein